MAPLDLSPFANAISQLGRGLEILANDLGNQLYRDGVIQRFEFTYSLGHRMLLRFLEQNSAVPEEIEQMSFATLIRTADEQGLLLSGWDKWQLFREARNITSHTYNQAKAEQVMAVVPDFFREAKFLYEQLNQRNR
jgi:nucleotidyltransferase substrate binding protein (TIGR01987 family)